MLQPSLGHPLHIASVDHGLRATAQSEAQTVLTFAARLGLPGTLLHVQVAAGASLQAQARDARYAALTRLARDLGIAHLCLGHTLDDQSETMLMRWLGGAGTRGLAGMRTSTRILESDGTPQTLLRPLLSVSRAQVDEFLQRADGSLAPLPFCDPSNRDPRYLRTRLRHEALPLLRSLAPHIDQHLLELSEQLRADADCLEALADQALHRLLAAAQPPSTQEVRLALPVRELAQLPAAISARVLRRIVGSGLSARHVAALQQLCSSTVGRKWLDLPGCGRVERNRDRLLIPTHAPPRSTLCAAPTASKSVRHLPQVLDGCADDA